MPLIRRPSFGRQKPAAKQPPTPLNVRAAEEHSNSSRDGSGNASPMSTGSDSLEVAGDVKMCKNLHGWLKKRHTSSGKLGPKWGKRYVLVDETAGTLCYTKSTDAPPRKCLQLADITSVESGAATGMPPNHFALRCKGAYAFEQLVFAAEDREDAMMWTNQLRLRAAHWASAAPPSRGRGKNVGATAEPGKMPELFTDSGDEDDEDDAMDAESAPPRTTQASRTRRTTSAAAAAAAIASAQAAGRQPSSPGLALRPSSFACTLELGRVRADFAAEHEIELGCTAGELLIPMPWMASPPGWSFAARTEGGTHGLVPTEYLEILTAYAHVPPTAPTSAVNNAHHDAELPPPPAMLPPPPAGPLDDGAGVFELGARQFSGSDAADEAHEVDTLPPPPTGVTLDDEGRYSLAAPASLAASASLAAPARVDAVAPPSPGKRKMASAALPSSPGKRKMASAAPPSPPHGAAPPSPLDSPADPEEADVASIPSLDDDDDDEAAAAEEEEAAAAAAAEEAAAAAAAEEAAAAAAEEAAAAAAAEEEAFIAAQERAAAEAKVRAEAEAVLAAKQAKARAEAERRRHAEAAAAAEAEAAAAAAAEAAAAAAAEAAAAAAEAAAAEEAARLVVAENNGVAIVADADFVEDDWDDDEE